MLSARLFCIVVLFMLLNVSIGQNKLDSLLNVLQQDIEPRERILTHNRIARIQINRDTTQAHYHKDIMDSLSVQHNDTLGRFLTAAIQNIFAVKNNDLEKSEAVLKEQLKLANVMNQGKFKTGVNYELSILKQKQGEMDSAIHYALESYKLFEESPEAHAMNKLMILNHLGGLSKQANKYKQALSYYLRADSMSASIDHYAAATKKGNLYNAIGRIYLTLLDTLNSIDYHRKSIIEYKIVDDKAGQSTSYGLLAKLHMPMNHDSTLAYLRTSLALAREVGSAYHIAEAQNLYGDYWLKQGDSRQALDYYNKSYDLFSSIDRLGSIAVTTMRMARLEEKQGNYQRALSLLDDASVHYESTENIDGRQAVSYSKALVLEKLGRHKDAITLLWDAYNLKDSLNFIKYNKEVKELQVQYETEKKQAALEKQDLVISKQRSERKSILGMGGLLFSFAGLLIWNLISRSKKNRKLSVQRDQLQEQKIIQLEKEKEIMSMASMIEGQEAERARIAKDLHDGLGGLLSSVKVRMTTIMDEIHQIESFNIYQRTTEMVDEACDEVRRISHNLIPGALRLQGLKTAVRHLAEELESTHDLTVSSELYGFDEPIDETRSTFIYRIIQESTNNIVKYAKASKVLIQMFESEDEYQIVIEDDGQGFSKIQDSDGLGLKSIRSRVNYLKGTLDLDTRVGIGTTLTINIPK